jgi:hypothetical protein
MPLPALVHVEGKVGAIRAVVGDQAVSELEIQITEGGVAKTFRAPLGSVSILKTEGQPDKVLFSSDDGIE